MNNTLSLFQGYSPNISNAGGQFGGIIQQMLQGLYQNKLAPRSMGTNGYQIPQNSTQIGWLDPTGAYHTGIPR